MCNNCERPSTVWGIDASGTAVAAEVERLLGRTLPHRPAGMEDIDGYVNIHAVVPAAIPEDIGIGLAIYVAADANLLLGTSRIMGRGPQQLAVAVFLGTHDDAPDIDGFALALGSDVRRAASVIAALVEAALLGPSGRDWLVWPEGTPAASVRHVISGVLSQGTAAEVFARGHPAGWGVGRAEGEAAAGRAATDAISACSAYDFAHGVVVAPVGASAGEAEIRRAIAAHLPRSAEWRVAVFRANGLEDDEVEVVVLGGGLVTVDEPGWQAGRTNGQPQSRA